MKALIAPGRPGIAPYWTSTAKIGVGTAMTRDSNIWFTISHGIINEVYFPHIDIANIRDMEFLITNGKDFFSEEKCDTTHEYTLTENGIPAYHLTNTCSQKRYRIEKTIITDPRHDVLLQQVKFIPLEGSLKDFHLYALLTPHICNASPGNNGWINDYRGMPMLFAERSGIALACAASTPFLGMSCGYVGTSDGWSDIHEHHRMTNFYSRASEGNIALTAEIDLNACNGEFVLAIGFAFDSNEAGLVTRASLCRGFKNSFNYYVESWKKIQEPCLNLQTVDKEGGKLYRISHTVLKTHEGKKFAGSVIASLSIPWGTPKTDNDLAGYHLISPRDQVQVAQAFLASGDLESARQCLIFLMTTQENDGHWVQCFQEKGSSFWEGLQLDETALPILLADQMRRADALDGICCWQMVEKAAMFLVKNGPITQQDRWQGDSGYTCYTIATEIAALLAAADFFDLHGKKKEAIYLREIADSWNSDIDHWLYVKNNALARHHQVEGYYVHAVPLEALGDSPLENQKIIIKHRPFGKSFFHYSEIVSTDALAFVRFGLRAADDPRILNTLTVIDNALKSKTKKGAIWHRYTHDGYGEHEDGSAFDGIGIGRGWPLLNGERGHYEIAKGDRQAALMQLKTIVQLAGVGGLIPEQIWDSTDIADKNLFNGESAGSTKPLVWAHAEYIQLLRSFMDNAVFGMPPQPTKRYLKENTQSQISLWSFTHKCSVIQAGKRLRIQAHNCGRVHWTTNQWKTCDDLEMVTNELNIFYADLPLENLAAGSNVTFTFFWPTCDKWEGCNYEVMIKPRNGGWKGSSDARF